MTSTVDGSRPRPGPSASTSLPAAAASSWSAAAAASPAPLTASGRVIDSSEAPSTTGRIGSGTATVTSPAPPRTAPRAARIAAPALPGPPAHSRTCPKSPLWPSAGRGMSSVASSIACSRKRSPAAASTSSGGMPRSATTTSPIESEAGGRTCATLTAAKVTVSSASRCGPGISWLPPFRPLGRSTARRGTGSRFRASTSSATGPSSGRLRPVPKRASITRSDSAAAAISRRSPPGSDVRRISSPWLRQIASWMPASPAGSRSPTRKTRTR